ncbi:hypothetical protein F4604DRAFT_1799888 [Suillus subluteus]|nr:hypothetical protein F4604DRAFT_1804926 [Suillus subluteus]KAG1855994.1 hypothetical protein F4604DRAFT_1799888 [Suillus subluteus]
MRKQVLLLLVEIVLTRIVFTWPVGVYCCAGGSIGRPITFASSGRARCVQSQQLLVDTSHSKTHLIRRTTIYAENTHQ